jgi:hypothetical protein
MTVSLGFPTTKNLCRLTVAYCSLLTRQATTHPIAHRGLIIKVLRTVACRRHLIIAESSASDYDSCIPVLAALVQATKKSLVSPFLISYLEDLVSCCVICCVKSANRAESLRFIHHSSFITFKCRSKLNVLIYQYTLF